MKYRSYNPVLYRTVLCLPLLAVAIASATATNNSSLAATEHACQQQSLQKPDTLYQDNLDGTVTDTETGLIWQKCSLGYSLNAHENDDPLDDTCDVPKQKKRTLQVLTRFDWQQAQNAVVSLNQQGEPSSQWRMPEATELMSLTDTGCANPAINTRIFPATQNTLYWTATESEVQMDDASAYLIYFSHVSQIALSKSRSYAVRLVKSDVTIATNEHEKMQVLETLVASDGH